MEHLDDAAKLLAALLAGALIGLERELHDKPAGFRTNTLICLGAAVFTLLSFRIAHATGTEVTRIAAQIVTGVGFLGAGAIIQSRGHVVGLTTAATVWSVASIGMAFGAGQYAIGVIATLLIHGVLIGLAQIEAHLERRRNNAYFEIDLERDVSPDHVQTLVARHGVRLVRFTVAKDDGRLVVHAEVVGRHDNIAELQAALVAEPAIRSIRRG